MNGNVQVTRTNRMGSEGWPVSVVGPCFPAMKPMNVLFVEPRRPALCQAPAQMTCQQETRALTPGRQQHRYSTAHMLLFLLSTHQEKGLRP